MPLLGFRRLRGSGGTSPEEAGGCSRALKYVYICVMNRISRCVSCSGPKREFVIDNLLVRIHFIIVIIRWTGLAPGEFEFPFLGSLASTFLGNVYMCNGSNFAVRVPQWGEDMNACIADGKMFRGNPVHAPPSKCSSSSFAVDRL